MKIPWILYHLAARAFFTWAMREINQVHDDVPRIIFRRLHHTERLQAHGWK